MRALKMDSMSLFCSQAPSLTGVTHLRETLYPRSSLVLAAFANAAIWTMFSHYNTDLRPVAKTESDNAIEQKFRDNREKCKEINLKMIKKKTKEHQL